LEKHQQACFQTSLALQWHQLHSVLVRSLYIIMGLKLLPLQITCTSIYGGSELADSLSA